MIASASTLAFADDPGSEKVKVTAPREWPSFGPIGMTGQPGLGPKCAEPTCGGRIIQTDGGESGTTTSVEKNKENKDAIDKAKKAVVIFRDAIKSSIDLINAFKKWMRGDVNIHDDNVTIEIRPDGTKIISGSCTDVIIDLGPESGQKPTCAIIKGGSQLIQRSNGEYENQLRLTYSVYKGCYYTKQCGVQSVNFIAGSEEELNYILNKVLGEEYFQ